MTTSSAVAGLRVIFSFPLTQLAELATQLSPPSYRTAECTGSVTAHSFSNHPNNRESPLEVSRRLT